VAHLAEWVLDLPKNMVALTRKQKRGKCETLHNVDIA
jgi:hypothetical protein